MKEVEVSDRLNLNTEHDQIVQFSEGDRIAERAAKVFVGKAGSPGRTSAMLGRPLYLKKADGPYLYDVDGNRYIDYHSSSGATFLGYNQPRVKQAMLEAVEMGYFCNYETEAHAEIAELICDSVPSAERVRFSNTGTEATLAAIRLARAVTGRSKVLKFEGHFHGMHELAWYNSRKPPTEPNEHGEIELVADTAGIPPEFSTTVVVTRFNDPESFRACMRRHKGEFACIIMEPIMYNAGCIYTDPDFALLVREHATDDGAVLIYDEVLSGFRMGLGGGQEYLGITPDLTTLAKALGGCGVPIAAVVGKREVMEGLNPVGKTVVSGTYTGHVMHVYGALEALKIMREPGFYERIEALAQRLYNGLREAVSRTGTQAVVQGLGARFGIHFGIEEGPLYHYRDVTRGFDTELNARFALEALKRGLYFHEYGASLTPNHHGFTAAHTERDIDETLDRTESALRAAQRSS
jgi:glutamate-1-semialdehyde 2,1-aminomutase